MSDGGIREAAFSAISRRWFYGWTILAVAGLGIFTSGPGQSHTFSVFVGPIGEDLGISNASIASTYGSPPSQRPSAYPTWAGSSTASAHGE